MKKGRLLSIFLAIFIIFIFSSIALAGDIPQKGGKTSAITNAADRPIMLAQATSSIVDESKLKPQYGGTLKMIWRRSPPKLGGPTNRSWGHFDGAIPVIETLNKFDRDGTPTFGDACLATGMDIAPDGKALTIYLRKGVMFHDGNELTSKDVKWHVENMKYSPYKFKKVKSVDMVDKYTVRMNLTGYDVTIPENFMVGHGQIASSAAVSKPTTPEREAWDHTIGSGAFKFVDWEKDVFIKYAKFDKYWDKGKPYLDGIEYTFITDPMTGKMAFEAGQAHTIHDLSPSDGADLRSKGFRVESVTLGGSALIPDGANPGSPFANQKVRLALEYAMDRKTMSDALGYGFSEPMYQATIFPMGYDPSLAPRMYDPEKAKKLLSEAGFPNGFETSLIINQREDRDMVGAIQNYLIEVGINAKIDVTDQGRNAKLHKEGWNNGIVIDQNIGGPIVPSSIQRALDAKGIRNKSALKPAGFQELLDKSIETLSETERKQLCQKMIKMIYDEAVMIPLYTKPTISALQKNVFGLNLMYNTPHPFMWYPSNGWLAK